MECNRSDLKKVNNVNVNNVSKVHGLISQNGFKKNSNDGVITQEI